jgi:hypothetical protein
MSFNEAVRKLTEAMEKNTEAQERPRDELGRFVSTGAGGSGSGSAAGGGGNMAGLIGGVMGKGGGFLAAAGPAGAALAVGGALVGAAADTARFLTPAAKAFAATGTSQGFASGVTGSLIGAAENTAIGGLVMALTGVSQAKETNDRAGGQVKNVTEQMARAGMNVPDKLRQQLADTAMEQERRVATERGKVDAITNSAENLAKSKPEGAGDGFDSVVSMLVRIEQAIKSLVGGKQHGG